MNRSMPRHLLHYVTRRLRLQRYLKDPGDGRQQPQIPAQTLLWALLIGQIFRESSFLAVEALVRSSARRPLRIATPFCDDTLGYFTGWLDPDPTRQALLSPSSGAQSELLDGLPGEAGERILAGDRSMPAAGWLSMGTEIWGL
jgi:hypothetical protein